LTVGDIEKLMSSDFVEYVIIQASDCYFGFNLKDDIERAYIYALIHTNSTEAINGWMVSKVLPDWVGVYSEWLTYEKKAVIDRFPDVNKADTSQSDSDEPIQPVAKRLVKPSRTIYSSSDEEEWDCLIPNNNQDPASKVNENVMAHASNNHRDNQVDKSHITSEKTRLGSSVCCDWISEGHCPMGLKPIKCQYSGGCNKFVHHICAINWATENNVEEGSIATLCRQHHPMYQKYAMIIENQKHEQYLQKHMDEYQRYLDSQEELEQHLFSNEVDAYKDFSSEGEEASNKSKTTTNKTVKENSKVKNDYEDEKFDPNMDIFKGESFQASLKANIKAYPVKRNSGVDMFVSGPFHNKKTGFVHWSVVYGNLNNAWMLKASFMSAYIKTVLTSLKVKPDDILHTASYHEINIRSIEHGEQSKWKRLKKQNGKIGTVSRLSFVFSCKIRDEANALVRLTNILDKVIWAMKARANNPIGPILFDHCEQHEGRILQYILEANKMNTEAVKDKLTMSIDSAFKNGYNLKYHCHLNQFMVDYDIIRVLKDDVGYKSWSDVSDVERAICFKGYSKGKALPDWDIQQEVWNEN
jgi:hypothetical protein